MERARLGIRTFDETVQALLRRPEFTDGELETLLAWYDCMISSADCGYGPDDYELGEKLKRMINDGSRRGRMDEYAKH
ncbi:MAG: hypothetical protein WCQ65_10685 [Fermentimonas sp.]